MNKFKTSKYVWMIYKFYLKTKIIHSLIFYLKKDAISYKKLFVSDNINLKVIGPIKYAKV